MRVALPELLRAIGSSLHGDREAPLILRYDRLSIPYNQQPIPDKMEADKEEEIEL